MDIDEKSLRIWQAEFSDLAEELSKAQTRCLRVAEKIRKKLRRQGEEDNDEQTS